MLRKGKTFRETESLLTAAQNKSIRTNYMQDIAGEAEMNS